MLFTEFESINLIKQIVVVVTGVLGMITFLLNIVCIIKATTQRTFCIVSTASNVIALSLFGCNCLVGLTAFAKELTFIFLGHKVPRYWLNFENYITIFCLVSSSLHIMVILLIYLINTFRTFPRPVTICGKTTDIVLICSMWILSFSPSILSTNDVRFPAFLRAISILLLTCICCLTPMAFCVIKFKQKTLDDSTSEQFDVKSNLIKKRWLQHRKKEKRICLYLLGTYLVCSIPYTIYYPVLSRIYTKDYKLDLIDNILFLFILTKCICDSIIYIAKKGWKRDRKKVNFSFENNGESPAHV